MKLRLVTGADTDAVVHVIRAVFDEYGFTWDPAEYHADLYDLERFYLSKGSAFWLAELDGSPVGTVALEAHPLIGGVSGGTTELEGYVRVCGTDCSLNRLYVHPEARRKGIGQALTERTIEEARARGYGAMEIWSDKRFGDAHRLYGRFGAVVVGERICDDPDVSPEWGLRLAIDY